MDLDKKYALDQPAQLQPLKQLGVRIGDQTKLVGLIAQGLLCLRLSLSDLQCLLLGLSKKHWQAITIFGSSNQADILLFRLLLVQRLPETAAAAAQGHVHDSHVPCLAQQFPPPSQPNCCCAAAAGRPFDCAIPAVPGQKRGEGDGRQHQHVSDEATYKQIRTQLQSRCCCIAMQRFLA
eukprot:1146445-Pelagomonas_calceolata.AAC.5